jgi:glutathione synthase/RimK-type ligase-like ATP-grasp enzyme
VRAFVVGERVIGAIERRAAGWKTNVSRGGTAHALTLPPAWALLALRAARAVGAEYAGVDLLPGADGTVYVLEVNGIPGWEGLQRATGLDVAGAILDHAAERARR